MAGASSVAYERGVVERRLARQVEERVGTVQQGPSGQRIGKEHNPQYNLQASSSRLRIIIISTYPKVDRSCPVLAVRGSTCLENIAACRWLVIPFPANFLPEAASSCAPIDSLSQTSYFFNREPLFLDDTPNNLHTEPPVVLRELLRLRLRLPAIPEVRRTRSATAHLNAQAHTRAEARTA